MKLAIIGAGLSGVMAYKYFKEMSYVESVKVFEIKDRTVNVSLYN